MPELAVKTSIGPVPLESDGRAITAVRIGSNGAAASDDPLLIEARRQLLAYFADRLASFNLPLASAAGARGQALRDAIVAIDPGATRSYGEIARAAGSSPSAVGQACAGNPLPLLVPCHRVVGSGGTIGHYSAGAGVDTKRWLLAHEAGDQIWAR